MKVKLFRDLVTHAKCTQPVHIIRAALTVLAELAQHKSQLHLSPSSPILFSHPLYLLATPFICLRISSTKPEKSLGGVHG